MAITLITQYSLDFFSHVCIGLQDLNPLPDYKILDWSKLKRIADDILKCI